MDLFTLHSNMAPRAQVGFLRVLYFPPLVADANGEFPPRDNKVIIFLNLN